MHAWGLGELAQSRVLLAARAAHAGTEGMSMLSSMCMLRKHATGYGAGPAKSRRFVRTCEKRSYHRICNSLASALRQAGLQSKHKRLHRLCCHRLA